MQSKLRSVLRLEGIEERVQPSVTPIDNPLPADLTQVVPVEPPSTVPPVDAISTTSAEGMLPTADTAKSPLSKAELDKLKVLVVQGENISPADAKIRDDLLARMAKDGIQFNGTEELKILREILDLAQKLPAPKLVKKILDAYEKAIDIAIGGLQKIDEARYQQYKRARDAGATHDEAWTWQNGGETAQFRYELEKLKEKAKKAAGDGVE